MNLLKCVIGFLVWAVIVMSVAPPSYLGFAALGFSAGFWFAMAILSPVSDR